MSSFKNCLIDEFCKPHKTPKNELINIANKFYSEELEPYFCSLYGDRWMSIRSNKNHKKEWIAHLVGISPRQAAMAVNKMCHEGKTQFIPSPLEFRSMCLSVTQSNGRINKLKIVRNE
ncbi:hypothetical protein [Vibrio sp. D431a]|uniref:hypothetical protein n=1 Tax=Vibrio sp. D431a TaxID=2837388 RepID=UPI00255285E9|nr:hypothetical protein [Vibrio sp. D431a]MDK9793829.1 hypothetical protein [Vibrio sp. D431a]